MTSWLSPGAIALACRSGVVSAAPAERVELHQRGRIRSDPAKKWMPLSARQTIDLQRCCFD